MTIIEKVTGVNCVECGEPIHLEGPDWFHEDLKGHPAVPPKENELPPLTKAEAWLQRTGYYGKVIAEELATLRRQLQTHPDPAAEPTPAENGELQIQNDKWADSVLLYVCDTDGIASTTPGICIVCENELEQREYAAAQPDEVQVILSDAPDAVQGPASDWGELRRLVEWAAHDPITSFEDDEGTVFWWCDLFQVNSLDIFYSRAEVKHKPNCLHLWAKAHVSALLATAGEAAKKDNEIANLRDLVTHWQQCNEEAGIGWHKAEQERDVAIADNARLATLADGYAGAMADIATAERRGYERGVQAMRELAAAWLEERDWRSPAYGFIAGRIRELQPLAEAGGSAGRTG